MQDLVNSSKLLFIKIICKTQVKININMVQGIKIFIVESSIINQSYLLSQCHSLAY